MAASQALGRSAASSAAPAPWLTAVLCASLLAAHAWPALGAALRYERDAVAAGEVWRLATAPFAHASWAYLAANLAVVALCGAWIEAHRRTALARALVLAWFASALLLVRAPAQLAEFSGASGPAIALAVFAALCGVSKGALRMRIAWGVVLASVLAKIGAESLAGFQLTAHSGVEAVLWPPSHQAGAAAGLASFVWGWLASPQSHDLR